MFRHHLFLLYDKIKTINASEPTYIENMIKSKKLLNMSLKSGKGHLKGKVYHYFIHTKVVKIFIKQLYMCWYYFYSPNMKYLTYTTLLPS